MSEYFADFVLALRDAQDVVTRLRTELPADTAGEEAELSRIADELGALCQEMAAVDTLPMDRAGEIVEQLRAMLLRSTSDRLMSLHPHLVQAIAATMRGAE
ncbi:MAG: hypothetical protein JSW71_17925 [Gemmatimonadota bacterium]|nr:MAG: hypothetical protein JSW71_17925 [Gemmatimonadota bacterium]